VGALECNVCSGVQSFGTSSVVFWLARPRQLSFGRAAGPATNKQFSRRVAKRTDVATFSCFNVLVYSTSSYLRIAWRSLQDAGLCAMALKIWFAIAIPVSKTVAIAKIITAVRPHDTASPPHMSYSANVSSRAGSSIAFSKASCNLATTFGSIPFGPAIPNGESNTKG
jgi:hypothetical protein